MPGVLCLAGLVGTNAGGKNNNPVPRAGVEVLTDGAAGPRGGELTGQKAQVERERRALIHHLIQAVPWGIAHLPASETW